MFYLCSKNKPKFWRHRQVRKEMRPADIIGRARKTYGNLN